ncbi:hypothetical protein [Noviherbaspirillum soli]|uniref:hypothetical protein n=1 Tax=Noviherbaspirillum soli TaxID=1064518 RepID=UPI00188A680E|nr:hypothetical protein [Noviherbaspirillum soli]
MNPINRSIPPGIRDPGRHDDTESTESCSEEEAAANRQYDETVSQLARALMAWTPELIGPDVPACASHPAAGMLALFLTELEVAARPRLALRREVLAWLKGLGGNAARQQQVLDKVGENSGTVPAMALYRLLREAN